jgi:hypothetical protein
MSIRLAQTRPPASRSARNVSPRAGGRLAYPYARPGPAARGICQLQSAACNSLSIAQEPDRPDPFRLSCARFFTPRPPFGWFLPRMSERTPHAFPEAACAVGQPSSTRSVVPITLFCTTLFRLIATSMHDGRTALEDVPSPRDSRCATGRGAPS